MTLGTPHERYDPDFGAALLHDLGEHHVSLATKDLLNRGVLSKLVRDPQKQKPGRQLKISEGCVVLIKLISNLTMQAGTRMLSVDLFRKIPSKMLLHWNTYRFTMEHGMNVRF